MNSSAILPGEYRVAVYGSLKAGRHNHRYLRTAAFIGRFRTAREYTMIDLGPYPAILPGGDTAIDVEIYAVDSKTLRALDELEEHPFRFRRTSVSLANMEVFIYVLNERGKRGSKKKEPPDTQIRTLVSPQPLQKVRGRREAAGQGRHRSPPRARNRRPRHSHETVNKNSSPCHRPPLHWRRHRSKDRYPSAMEPAMKFEETRKPFGLADILHLAPHSRLNSMLAGMVERILRLGTLEKTYLAARSGNQAAYQFLHALLKQLNIRYQVHRENFASRCAKGPAIVVANHPFGGIDAVVMACVLLGIRGDVKILANGLLLRIPELKDLLIGVDSFGGRQSRIRNGTPLREAADWVKKGGMLMLFPAGEVAHFRLGTRRVTDSEWKPLLGWLVEVTGAPVIPAYFHGQNSRLFQMLGLLHPVVRTCLLPRELINKRNLTFHVALGTPVDTVALRAFGDRAKVVQYLRLRTHSLKPLCTSDTKLSMSVKAFDNQRLPVVDAPDRRLLADEIGKLPGNCCLVEHEAMAVYCFKADQAPWVLQEVGRLRELTFRASGEGTGMPSDIDLYDAYYRHLVIWNRAEHAVVGAYRLGLTDEILRRSGKRRLYTQTLFRYRRPLLNVLNPGIELGRSFVREEYRRDYAPLLLLWKAIGHFIARHPRYRRLFGPVSISNEYQTVSQQLLVDFLRLNRFDVELARYVKPRRPFRYRNPVTWWGENQEQSNDLRAVSGLIAEIEADSKGVPILIKHYLKLGGRFLGFNVDDRFSHVLDGLILVDLYRTDIRLLRKYMGAENASSFIAYHQESWAGQKKSPGSGPMG